MLPVQIKTSEFKKWSCLKAARSIFLHASARHSTHHGHSKKVRRGKLDSGSVHCTGHYLPNTHLWIPVKKTTDCQLAWLTGFLRHLQPACGSDINLQKGLKHSCHIQRILSKCFCSYISDFMFLCLEHSFFLRLIKSFNNLPQHAHTSTTGRTFPESSRHAINWLES